MGQGILIPGHIPYAFQPIFDVRGEKDVIYGYEALMRPEGMTPMEFVSNAKAHGALHDLEFSTFYNATKQFFERGLEGKLFINSFPYEILSPDERDLVLPNIPDNRLSDIVVENLEYGKDVDIVKLSEKLVFLRSNSWQIALDDFGTGINSINALKILNPDIVKVDRYFVIDCLADMTKRNILDIIIHTLKLHGVQILVEGVETKEVYDYLKNVKVDYIQGFYLGKPA